MLYKRNTKTSNFSFIVLISILYTSTTTIYSFKAPFNKPKRNPVSYFFNAEPLSSSLLITSSTLLQQTQQTMKYWNRETSEPQQYDKSKPIIQTAKIISLSDINDPANDLINKNNNKNLPDGAQVVAIGSSIIDFDLQNLKQIQPNVIFVSSVRNARDTLATLIQELPSIQWIHARSAGIDAFTSQTLSSTDHSHIFMTNAKGQFSSTLAEYSMMAISYFAKDLPRLLQQQQDKQWIKYSVEEIRGKTLGIVGYGDIGKATARLAKAYGMKIIALRRNPITSPKDDLCDVTLSSSNDPNALYQLLSSSDYVLCAAPLTPETKGLFNVKAFSFMKPHAVFINVGRGAIVEEDALIDVLKNGKLKGAALDVFAVEPLPVESELWSLRNVLMSPHNMDQTETFMQEATEFFIQENLPRFLRGEELLNLVDKSAGY